MMSLAEHTARSAVVLLWSGWIAYTCFVRAARPPKDRQTFWINEIYTVNKNWAVRILNVLGGLLVLAIGISIAFKK